MDGLNENEKTVIIDKIIKMLLDDRSKKNTLKENDAERAENNIQH